MKVRIIKLVLLWSTLLACLFGLRATSLEVHPGEQSFSHALSLEMTCLPAIWVMLYTTLLHSLLPLLLQWKAAKKLCWTVTLPVFLFIFMPRTLYKQTELAMVLFCREYGKKTSVFAFVSELWEYNAWYMKAMMMFVILELLLYVCYFIATHSKVGVER